MCGPSVVGPSCSTGLVQHPFFSLMFFVVVLASAIDSAVSVIVVVCKGKESMGGFGGEREREGDRERNEKASGWE